MDVRDWMWAMKSWNFVPLKRMKITTRSKLAGVTKIATFRLAKFTNKCWLVVSRFAALSKSQFVLFLSVAPTWGNNWKLYSEESQIQQHGRNRVFGWSRNCSGAQAKVQTDWAILPCRLGVTEHVQCRGQGRNDLGGESVHSWYVIQSSRLGWWKKHL